jgi:hypothetical protein
MWKVIGASVAGTSHEAAGKGCEDASGWRTDAGLTCLAVADGAGSRPMAGRGAALAVQRALLLAGADGPLADGPQADGPQAGGPRAGGPHGGGPRAGGPGGGDPAGWLRLIFEDVREQLTALASAEGNDVADYATTLAVAILTGHLVSIGQIGDTIAVTGLGEKYQTVAPAPRAEYVNETTFVTGQHALAQLRITVKPVSEVDAVFLATDGLRFKILDDLAASTPFAPFFGDLAAYARSPLATGDAVRRFLAEVDDQSGDDKTLVAAVR